MIVHLTLEGIKNSVMEKGTLLVHPEMNEDDVCVLKLETLFGLIMIEEDKNSCCISAQVNEVDWINENLDQQDCDCTNYDARDCACGGDCHCHWELIWVGKNSFGGREALAEVVR